MCWKEIFNWEKHFELGINFLHLCMVMIMLLMINAENKHKLSATN